MLAVIDTNIAIYLRDGSSECLKRLDTGGITPVFSIITQIELEGGVAARPHLADRLRSANDALLAEFEVLAVDRFCADAYAAILASTGYSRRLILDRLIAATAIANNLPLITINAADFADIPGLTLEVWPAPAQ